MEISLADDGAAALSPATLEGLPGVRSVHSQAGSLFLTVTEPHVAIPPALEALRSANRTLASLTTRHASLEDVFVSLTGRRLRDE